MSRWLIGLGLALVLLLWPVKNSHFSECAYGSFQRAFELSASVDRGKIAADSSKGVLTITLPKSAAAQQPTKKIEVKAS